MEEANAEWTAVWWVYQCVMCRGETRALVRHGLRTWENMPFKVDSLMDRLISVMCKQGKKLGAEIEELKGKGTREDGNGKWAVMEARWGDEGEMVQEREYGQQASMDAMARFKQFWMNLESREIIGCLGLFRRIDRGD